MMFTRITIWGGITILTLIIVLLIIFPMDGLRYWRLTDFVFFRSASYEYASGGSDQKQFLRLELNTALRGLYQPLASFINENGYKDEFKPSIDEFALALGERSETISSFSFTKEGVVKQFGDSRTSDQELNNSLQRYIGNWQKNDVHPVTKTLFGGNGRLIDDLFTPTDTLGGLLLFSTTDDDLVGDTAVGLVFDPDWILAHIPALFDSVKTNWLTFWWLSTWKDKDYDFGYGVVDAGDTLYWYGDHTPQDIDRLYHHSSYSKTSFSMAP